MDLYPLPPGVRAETFTYANGRQETVYRAPFESEGPRLLVENDQKVLYFMYAAYVFRWPQNATRLDIGHGTIDDHMDLWQGVPITGAWTAQTSHELRGALDAPGVRQIRPLGEELA